MKRIRNIGFLWIAIISINSFGCKNNEVENVLNEYESVILKWEHKKQELSYKEFEVMKKEIIAIVAEVESNINGAILTADQKKRIHNLNERMYKLVLNEW